MAVFTRERKNGYYGIGTFVISNTIASAPFIFGIALLSSVTVSSTSPLPPSLVTLLLRSASSSFSICTHLHTCPSLSILQPSICISPHPQVYWLINLNDDGDRFPYFVINLYTSLTVVESIMVMIAAIVPHYLMGIAAGAGLLGM
jgi:hypothetical protein